jgi:amino acid transporter
MDATHMHLLVNHIPILGSIFGALLLGIGMALRNRSVEITALCTLLLAVLFTLPAYFSGEEAEHMVEHMASVSEYELEEHEEHAELSVWMMVASGVMALMTLVSYSKAKHLTNITRMATLIVSLIAFATMVPLALHGGKIIHSELRGSPTDGVEHEVQHHELDEEE